MQTDDLKGRRVLMVIAPEQFRDEELFETKAVLEGLGASVTVASKRVGIATGMLGGKCQPSALLAEVSGRGYDAVAIVGGMGSPAHLWEDERLRGIVQDASRADRIVASICLSGAVLAKAGVLDGKRATVWKTRESLDALKRGGAKYIEEDVVVDGRTVTASGPHAARAFGEAIARLLRET